MTSFSGLLFTECYNYIHIVRFLVCKKQEINRRATDEKKKTFFAYSMISARLKLGTKFLKPYAPVAQLDRATDF